MLCDKVLQLLYQSLCRITGWLYHILTLKIQMVRDVHVTIRL